MGSATEWVGRGSNGRSLAQSVRNWSTDILMLTGCLSSAKDFLVFSKFLYVSLLFFSIRKEDGFDRGHSIRKVETEKGKRQMNIGK